MVNQIQSMKVREMKEDEGHKCPIRIIYGNSKNWGRAYDEQVELTPYVVVFVKSMTARNFFDTLDHELFHYHLSKIRKDDKKKWSLKKEHWIIDKLLNYQEDWY